MTECLEQVAQPSRPVWRGLVPMLWEADVIFVVREEDVGGGGRGSAKK